MQPPCTPCSPDIWTPASPAHAMLLSLLKNSPYEVTFDQASHCIYRYLLFDLMPPSPVPQSYNYYLWNSNSFPRLFFLLM